MSLLPALPVFANATMDGNHYDIVQNSDNSMTLFDDGTNESVTIDVIDSNNAIYTDIDGNENKVYIDDNGSVYVNGI